MTVFTLVLALPTVLQGEDWVRSYTDIQTLCILLRVVLLCVCVFYLLAAGSLLL